MKPSFAVQSVLIVILFTLISCGGSGGTGKAAYYVVDGNPTNAGGKAFIDNRQYAKKANTESLRDDGIHDHENPAIETLQEPEKALGKFPYDRRGGVDWVQAINKGEIKPREGLNATDYQLVMDMNILFTDTGDMPHILFPHKQHTQWLDCSNCHPKIFTPQKGSNNISMDGILAGEHCGRCHDKVAFSLWICERCHNTPHAGSGPAWWDQNKQN